MPKPLQYKAGSLIYFQGDMADKVFILQSGAVNLKYQDIETGDDINDLVQPGEFFGVKSALGRYPREENAMASKDATVMAFTVPEFEALSASNTRIVMKMLKVLSNQLRRVHKQVSSLMEKKDELDPETGLFNVGDYYLKNKNFNQAHYVFGRYLTYYPSGKHATQAATNLQQAEQGVSKGGGIKPAFATPAPSVSPAPHDTQSDTAKAYTDATNLVSQQKYQLAYLAFKKIVDANEDAGYAAKSAFEIGRCFFHLNKLDDCIKYFTVMITKYPKHPQLTGVLFYMGQCYEKSDRKEQAKTFYQKVLSMPADEDDVKSQAGKALAALEA